MSGEKIVISKLLITRERTGPKRGWTYVLTVDTNGLPMLRMSLREAFLQAKSNGKEYVSLDVLGRLITS